ncbi:LysR family transcriptional regulator [Amycolatopsis sp. 195334CR]|uniref:LysR family transcriptional regulator n=1 Tax=Amycolatopsis sp. 195334CR TaxID=2814588 RepID=UPI001A90C94C|nr:LysR family transcriptional regulator [Amycolatopsis sp. 195334CR]MBN6039738.1 LysR family transcriptional regulator [Amycolatopsis sp. 195334CR]
MLTWERLRVFAAVAEHGSISAAAAVLHVTGPAVTQQIRKLEREAGAALLEPDGRGVRLTAAGWIVAEAAREMTEAAGRAEHALHTLHGRVSGPLRVGALNSSFGLLLGPALRVLADRHPEVVPSTRSGEPIDLIPMLGNRKLDAVVVESWSTLPVRVPPRIRLEPLLVHEVVLTIAATHRLAGRASLTLDQVRDEVWTACRPGTDSHEAQLQAMRRHGVEARIHHVVDDFPTQMALVANELAVTLVPRPAVEGFPGVSLVPVEPAITRTIAVATRENSRLPAVDAFLSVLREVAAA